MKKTILFLVILGAFLNANEKSKEYYLNHLDEAKAKYNECSNNYLRFKNDKAFANECKNAEYGYEKAKELEEKKEKFADELSTLASDLMAYYTSQGKFASNIQDMTNIKISDQNGNDFKIKTDDGVACADIKFNPENKQNNRPATLKITFLNLDNEFCKAMANKKWVKDELKTKKMWLDNKGKEQSLDKNEIVVSRSPF